MKRLRLLLALVALTLPSTAATVTFNSAYLDNFNFVIPLENESGAALPVGSVVQYGYFAGLSTSLDVTTFTQTEWDTFTPISGDGSLNPSIITAIGDGGASAGYYTNTVNFDSVSDNGIPDLANGDSAVRIGIRIFNSNTEAGSTYFNTVTSNNGPWIMQPATSPPPTPTADLDASAANLHWESSLPANGGAALATTIPTNFAAVPEASEALIVLIGLFGIVRHRRR